MSKSSVENDAILSFMEGIAIKETCELMDKWYRQSMKRSPLVRVPKCLLSDSFDIDADDFNFDEEHIAVIKKHFRFK